MSDRCNLKYSRIALVTCFIAFWFLIIPKPAFSQASGDTKLTMGFSYSQQSRSAVVDSNTEKIPTEITVNPLSWVTLDISSDTYDWKKLVTTPGTSGAGDTTFSGSTLLHLGSAASWNPSVTLTYAAKVATSDASVGPANRHVQNIVELGLQLANLPLWNRLGVILKIGPSIQHRNGGGTNAETALEFTSRFYLDRNLAAGTPRTTISNTVTYFSEATLSPAMATDSISLIRKVGNSFWLTGGTKIGIAEASPRFGVFFTVAHQFNFLGR
jgi:hypothetical protein